MFFLFRCAKFIDELTGECLDKCVGETKVVNDGIYQGNVCKRKYLTVMSEHKHCIFLNILSKSISFIYYSSSTV